MKLYGLIRPILFCLEPELAHRISLWALDWLNRLGLIRLLFGRPVDSPVEVMGIKFPNPVGLAAGLDKNGDHINSLSACGFGFIEIGTVTPVAQPGNEAPRLFRLVEDKALINRMGFNNKGVDYLVKKVEKSHASCILGINIGKNKNTDNSDAASDYLYCFKKVYPVADYITVNISSPNTPGLRQLQYGDALRDLLFQLKQEQAERNAESGRYVPLVVKIAPDLDNDEVEQLAKTLMSVRVDGVIATNTTNDRPVTLRSHLKSEQGGLSGSPLTDKADRLLEHLSRCLGGQIPVIASGGVMSPEDVARKIALGASLVQVYTGFIYHGPELVHSSIESGS